ncbi:MAG: hypothetical protein HY710_09960 [Candidatus Latescibacteria bacterium]|nr:hypothetical protein [Candidatus Latescibacterota bacterium]
MPEWGATGLSSLLPLPLWGNTPHDRFFEHPVALLAVSKPRATTSWMLDRTLEERAARSVDRIRIRGTQGTLDFVSPLMTDSDSVYLGHIAVRFEHADRRLALPISSSGRLLRHHLDYRYGQVTYARPAGPHWRFGGSVGVIAQPGDRQVSYTVQSTYEPTDLFQVSVTIGQRSFRQDVDLDFKKGLGQTRYRFDVQPSEQRITVAATSHWTPSLSWAVEGNRRTIQSATRATGSEGAFRFPVGLKQWAVRTGPTLQLFSGGVRLWSHVQSERYGMDMTLLREERGNRAGRLHGTGHRWGWETGLFSMVSRRAGFALHAAEHRVTWDASGSIAPQQIVDLPLLFDWVIGHSLERQFYQTTLHLGVRGLGLMYTRKVMRGGLLSVGAHRTSIRLEGALLDWSYPKNGPIQSHDRQVAMRPKILNTLLVEARYPVRIVTLYYRLTRLIPQQGPAAISTGWNPVDTQLSGDHRLKTGSLHVWSLSYGF